MHPHSSPVAGSDPSHPCPTLIAQSGVRGLTPTSDECPPQRADVPRRIRHALAAPKIPARARALATRRDAGRLRARGGEGDKFGFEATGIFVGIGEWPVPASPDCAPGRCCSLRVLSRPRHVAAARPPSLRFGAPSVPHLQFINRLGFILARIRFAARLTRSKRHHAPSEQHVRPTWYPRGPRAGG